MMYRCNSWTLPHWKYSLDCQADGIVEKLTEQRQAEDGENIDGPAGGKCINIDLCLVQYRVRYLCC